MLNALAQIDGVEPPDALLLQQVAALGDIMCAGWEAIYESTALSRGMRIQQGARAAMRDSLLIRAGTRIARAPKYPRFCS